jgi:thiamine-phosphate pyrophosphorylase
VTGQLTVPRLLLVTDRRQLPAGRTLEQVVRDCARAGVRWIWVREQDLPLAERAALVDRLARIPDVVVVAGRRWHPGAAGIHLPSGAPAPPGVGFHGRSCHDVAEVRRAVAGGAGYVTVSPVAASASKPGHGPALGTAGVARAVGVADGVPVLALGGVTADNAASFVAAGAHGVAVMGSVMRAEDPARVVRDLSARLPLEVAR